MSEQQDPPQGNSSSDERNRRIQALRRLSQPHEEQGAGPGMAEMTSPPPETPELTPALAPRSRKRVIVAVVSTLTLVAVVGGLVTRIILSPASSTHPRQTPAAFIINPADNDFACPKDIAWSPDSKTVALLGYQRNCANSFPTMYSYHPGIITLYDISNGKGIGRIQPDRIIAAALRLSPPMVATPIPNAAPADRDSSQQVIDYGHVLWSPDGKQLAVSFSVSITRAQTVTGNFNITVIEGVLLLDPSGAEPHVISHILAHGEYFSHLWNLTTGSYIPLAVSSPAPDVTDNSWGAELALMPPALAYQWANDGHLRPVTPLDATTAPAHQPLVPVGQPDGDKEFTIWQPGVAQIITQDSSQPPQPLKAPVETWRTSLASWSADGKYLFTGDQGNEVANWRIALSGQPVPDRATLASVGLANAPLLPVRDAGMAAALQRYHTVSLVPSAQYIPVNLAWSPDGRQIAVEANLSASGEQPQLKDFAVHIYDCASGKLLKTLTPHLAIQTANNVNTYLRWSPDGAHLLFYTTALSGAQVWGPRDLPR